MDKPGFDYSAPLEPTAALRSLCAEPAATFGARLLARTTGPAIPFRTFVQVARDMVTGQPDAAATWLAAMVALDMFRDRCAPPPEEPSPN
ncbi:MAG: hypothetical protein AB7O97_19055 [Planctomycetota bacterium]